MHTIENAIVATDRLFVLIVTVREKYGFNNLKKFL